MNLTEHLKSRHLDMTLHHPVLDEGTRTVTFFLYNLSGQLVGFQQYKPDEFVTNLVNQFRAA